MGGFGAVKLALRHPDLFAFVGGISAAIDVARRQFPASRFERLNSRATTTRFSGKAVARRTAITIHLFMPGSPIQKKAILFCLMRPNERGCCLQTVNLPRCLVDGIFDISCTLLPELTIGNSGMTGCPSCFGACRVTELQMRIQSTDVCGPDCPACKACVCTAVTARAACRAEAASKLIR
jgi:hypothetical protein